MLDPATTWIDVTVGVEPDATIEPNTQLRGATSVGRRRGGRPGHDTRSNVVVGAGARVVRTHGSDAVIGAGANVGPFAYLRPGTDLAEAGKIGTFVETKNARIGAGSKVPHLSYVGDATIGEDVNIGAATIFVNYDGSHKHHTTVERRGVFVGCDTMLVAPVTVRRRRLHRGRQRRSTRTCRRARSASPGRRSATSRAGSSANGPAPKRKAAAAAADSAAERAASCRGQHGNGRLAVTPAGEPSQRPSWPNATARRLISAGAERAAAVRVTTATVGGGRRACPESREIIATGESQTEAARPWAASLRRTARH